MVVPELTRSRALLRDEGRLREVLSEHEARRFDAETLTRVREHTENLLETLSAIAADDEFWSARARGAPLAKVDRAALQSLDPTAFETLLVASGYRHPPPPAASELVDDTLAELTDALQTWSDPEDQLVAAQAGRRGLILTIMRIRRQLTPLEPDDPDATTPSRIRTAARRSLRVARWMIPKAVGAAAGALVEAHTPGSGLGVIVGKAVSSVFDSAIELGAERLLARLAPSGLEPAVAHQTEPFAVSSPTAAIRAHIVEMDRILDVLDSQLHDRELRPGGDDAIFDWMGRVRTHALRVRELMRDHNLVDSPQAQKLYEAAEGLAGLPGGPDYCCTLADISERWVRTMMRWRAATRDPYALLDRGVVFGGLVASYD